MAPNGGVDASLWNDRTLTTTGLGYEESPGLPLWLQIRMDEQGESYFEWSPDAITWNQLANGTFPECGDFTGAIVMGVNVGGQLDAGEGTRRIDRFEACVP